MIEQVASQLGNTAAICRKSYIHPLVIERGRAGIVLSAVTAAARSSATGLNPSERALLHFLRASPTSRLAA
jgi:DNA topoisomerase-1